MPAVTLDGAVAERTGDLRYLGIHFHIMLTYRKHVETTALKCKKGLSVLKAVAAKGIEQCHLFLLYQSVVLSVIDYGLGLTTMAQTNLLTLDRVQNEAMRVTLGTTKHTPIETMRFMLDLPSIQTRQKVEQVKTLLCRRKSPQPAPRSREKHRGMQTGTGQVSDGSNRGLSTASMPADRAPANQGVGKISKPIPASLWDTLARKLGKALSRMASRRSRVREIKLLIQENRITQHLMVYIDGPVTKDQSGRGGGWGGGGGGGTFLSSKVRLPSMNTVQPIWSRPPTCRIARRGDSRTVSHSHHPNIFIIQWPCYKKWKVEWEALTECVNSRHPPRTNLWVYCPGPAGVKENDRADRLVGKATITGGLLSGRIEVLKSLIHYLRAQSQRYHTIDRLHERGWTIFFQRTREGHRQSGEHWNRFKGNVGVTSENGVEYINGLFRVHRYQLELNWTMLLQFYVSTALCYHSFHDISFHCYMSIIIA